MERLRKDDRRGDNHLLKKNGYWIHKSSILQNVSSPKLLCVINVTVTFLVIEQKVVRPMHDFAVVAWAVLTVLSQYL